MKKIGIIFFSLLLLMSGCSNNEEIEVEEAIEKLEYTEVKDIVELMADERFYTEIGYTDEQKTEVYRNSEEMEKRVIYTIIEDGIEEEFKEAMREVPYNLEYWELRHWGWEIVYIVEEYEGNIDNEHEIRVVVEQLRYAAAMKVTDLNKERKETYYTTSTSEEIHLAIQEAAIIAQGPGTAGFDEALDSAWETAKRNGEEGSFESFKDSYTKNTRKYTEQYQEMAKMSTQEIAVDYDVYADALEQIEANLNIIPN